MIKRKSETFKLIQVYHRSLMSVSVSASYIKMQQTVSNDKIDRLIRNIRAKFSKRFCDIIFF